MNSLPVMLVALLLPLAGLALLLWLSHLEDTLPRDVRATARQPDPAPILAVPAGPEIADVVQISAPAQPMAQPVPSQREGSAQPVSGEALTA